MEASDVLLRTIRLSRLARHFHFSFLKITVQAPGLCNRLVLDLAIYHSLQPSWPLWHVFRV
jgi:hypothetical protein